MRFKSTSTVHTVDGDVTISNEYFDGKWKPVKWTPSEKIAHCVQCHGPETFPDYTDGMNQQQGHMECLLCHADHTK
jgi:hypothetical protein